MHSALRLRLVLLREKTLSDSEVDMAAVQRTLPVDKTMSNILGISCTLLKNSYTLESRSVWSSFIAHF